MTFRLKALSAPALVWFLLFILSPVLLIAVISFASRGTYGGIEWRWGFGNYGRAFSVEAAWIVFDTLKMALGTAVVCLALGTLCAWAMVTSKPAKRQLLFGLIAIPFLTNLIIRVYALKSFVGGGGPLQATLTALSVPFDPFEMTTNPVLVFYGLVTSYLPFAILPLYGAFERFDFSLVEAAQDLGAGSLRILLQVILPNLRKALTSAFFLVFIPCLGEYVIPDLLGGAKTLLLGNLLTEQFLKSRDWPFGAALAVIMIAVLLVATGLATLRRRGEAA